MAHLVKLVSDIQPEVILLLLLILTSSLLLSGAQIDFPQSSDRVMSGIPRTTSRTRFKGLHAALSELLCSS
jgi:hypothetical protein